MIFWKRSPYLFSSIYYTVEVDGHQNGLFTSILQNIIFHVLPTGLKSAMRVSKWWQDFNFWMSFFFNRECSPAFCVCACMRTCVCVFVWRLVQTVEADTVCADCWWVFTERVGTATTRACQSEREKCLLSVAVCHSCVGACMATRPPWVSLSSWVTQCGRVKSVKCHGLSTTFTPSLAIHRVNIDSYLLFNSRLQVLLVGGILSFWHLNRQNW